MQCKFTVQRVNEALFFEVTTSRSYEDVNGFHNVTFGPGGKAIIYFCSVFRYDSWFQPLKLKLSRFLGVFAPFVGHFFKRAREPEVKLRHVVYEVWLVSYLFSSFQIWYFRKWIITSIGQSKHMRVTRFNPLWVSVLNYCFSPICDCFLIIPLYLGITHGYCGSCLKYFI